MTPRRNNRWLLGIFMLSLLAGLAPLGCGSDDDGERVIRVWAHHGQEDENRAMREMVAAFNEAHEDENIRVEIQFFPDSEYGNKLSSAATVGQLPDAFDLDGPLLASYVDAGLVRPIGEYFSDEELGDFIPTIIEQGTVGDKLYALGAFDSALVLYYDRKMLADAGVTPPEGNDAWTWQEFLAACEKIQESGVRPLAMHMNQQAAEWFTYAFVPVVWSAGGKLIDTKKAQVDGVLDSQENLEAISRWKEVFENGYAQTSPVGDDPFGAGETAMDWSGHWMAGGHMDSKGDRLGVMPLPRTGEEKSAPSGSWCWGVSAATEHPEVAAKWVRWAVDPNHGVVPMVRANGAPPARLSALQHLEEYREPPLNFFMTQLRGWARPRPKTPYYQTLTQNFAAALRDIATGAEVGERLGKAAGDTQRVIDRQGGG